MLSNLKRSTKRLMALLAVLPATVFVLGTLYMVGMDHLEGTPRTLLASLQWATETLTTTGYGGDNHWQHPVMAAFVIAGQFMGQFLIFLIFPIFLLPYFEEQFEVRLQHILPHMEGKVLFYRYGPALESLLDEFKRTNSPFVIFEEDMAVARNLRDRHYNVVFGKLADDPSALRRVRNAKAVVTNAGDYDNATCAMIVREHGFEGPLYALAGNPLYRPPMLQIGATDVFTPAHVLGAAIASRASVRISPPAEGMHLLGSRAGIAEFRVRAGSPLDGRSLGDLHLREEHGISIIGQWQGGKFITPHGQDTRIEAGGILVAVGTHANLESFERMVLPIRRTGPIVVAGYGSVGQKIIQMLHDAGESTVIIDNTPAPGVSIVGNILEQETLRRADVQNASSIILVLNDDSESVFAAAVVRDFAPDVPLIVRVKRTSSTERIYRAGADFALSVGQVAGQILAYHLLDEQAIPVENRLKFSRLTAGRLAGKHPWRNDRPDHSVAEIVAIERGDDFIIRFDNDFSIRDGDALFVCGTLEGLAVFQKEFQAKVYSPTSPPKAS